MDDIKHVDDLVISNTTQLQENTNLNSKPFDEISIFDLFFIIWKSKNMIIVVTLLTIIVGIIYALISPEIFSTNAYFITKTGHASSGSLSQIASLAGMSFGNNGNVDPSEYLDKITEDQAFIATLYQCKWYYNRDSLYLDQILNIKKDTNLTNWQHTYYMSKINCVRKRKMIGISKDIKTSVLRLSVNAPDPQLSCELNRYILNYISDYLRNSLKTQAKEKRIFIEDRIKETKIDLEKNENYLAKFRESNIFNQSPHLALEEARLIRKTQICQEVFLQFQKQYELTRIEELDDQTLIQVVKTPEIPLDRSKPNRMLIVIISFFFGIFFGISGALIKHCVHRVIILLRITEKKANIAT